MLCYGYPAQGEIKGRTKAERSENEAFHHRQALPAGDPRTGAHMSERLRADAAQIVAESIRAVLPDEAVRRALEGRTFPGRVLLIAAGKAAWRMAAQAERTLGGALTAGIVITKYGHAAGDIPRVACFEGGHPLPDENGFRATERALALTRGLAADDTVLLLLSGGGSALFELPAIPAAELVDVYTQLLRCGADIVETNTVRKRLSLVKGGRFAAHCAPARVIAVILSDIVGDPVDMIASGPVSPDPSTAEAARSIAEKYALRLSPAAWARLEMETPKRVDNTETLVTGSVRLLCRTAQRTCETLGYRASLITDALTGEAREAGTRLASLLCAHAGGGEDIALIMGGETTVRVTGQGLGGRNQELALAAAAVLDGLPDAAVFSVGSDGTDGPTDAAGGYADGGTAEALREKGLDIAAVLANNDAYHALFAVGGLLVTGPTGTNVNDVSVALIRRKQT